MITLMILTMHTYSNFVAVLYMTPNVCSNYYMILHSYIVQYYGLCTYLHTAIKIDLLICDNNEEWQVSEETSCLSYEYENLTSHMTQVCNILLLLI